MAILKRTSLVADLFKDAPAETTAVARIDTKIDTQGRTRQRYFYYCGRNFTGDLLGIQQSDQNPEIGVQFILRSFYGRFKVRWRRLRIIPENTSTTSPGGGAFYNGTTSRTSCKGASAQGIAGIDISKSTSSLLHQNQAGKSPWASRLVTNRRVYRRSSGQGTVILVTRTKRKQTCTAVEITMARYEGGN